MQKTITKRIRLSPKEWEAIREKMQEVGQDSFSSYARACMLNVDIREKSPLNRAFVAELCRWGNNLNQVSKHLNSEKKGIDRVALEMLSRIESHLQALRQINAC